MVHYSKDFTWKTHEGQRQLAQQESPLPSTLKILPYFSGQNGTVSVRLTNLGDHFDSDQNTLTFDLLAYAKKITGRDHIKISETLLSG